MWLLPLLLISLVGMSSGCTTREVHWADAYANGKRTEERKQALRADSYSFEKAQPSAVRSVPPPSMMLDLPPVPRYDQYPARSWEMIRTPSGALYYNYGNGMIQTPHGVELYTIY